MATHAILLPAEIPGSADQRRALLAQGWLDDDQIAAMLGGQRSASDLRRDGCILGLWIIDESRYVHPIFQFDDGDLIPTPAEILKILP